MSRAAIVEEENEAVRRIGRQVKSKKARLVLVAKDHGRIKKRAEIELLIDSRVNKTLLREEDWNKMSTEGRRV